MPTSPAADSKPALEKPSSFVTAPDPFIAKRIVELTESDAQFRDALSKPEVNEAKLRNDLNLAQILAAVMEGYAERPALGVRASEAVTDPESGRTTRRLLEHFDTVTYGELWHRAGLLCNLWHGDEQRALRANDMICIIAFAGIDFATVDIAAFRNGSVPVPLQTNGQISQLLEIVREVEPRWLATSLESLDTSVQLAIDGHRPAGILLFDYHPEVDCEREAYERAQAALTAAGLGDTLVTLSDALTKGAAAPTAPLFDQTDCDERLSTIFYTSGSTGLPKGAMYPEKMNKFQWRSVSPIPFIYMHYAPMNHAFGRLGVFSTLCAGGTCYFTAKSDLSALFDDIKLVRPTYMGFVPRICEMVYQHYQVELEHRTPDATDLAALQDELIVETRHAVLGGRILGGSIGSAPLSMELRQFMEQCLGFKMADGYGATEIGGATINNKIMRPIITDFRLDDVPELGYFSTDKPYPRGELWVKSICMMLGYYKRPEVTASVMTEDGFYKTGDIMEQVGPEEFVYLDRRNNVQKLAQGEFVAIAQLETLYTNAHALIQQLYLYGTSERSFLLAVIVPSHEALTELGIDPQDHPAVRVALRQALKDVAREERLNAYEVPRDFIVEHTPFSVENGLLAGIGKYQRPRFKEQYSERLEALYDEILEGQANELAQLRKHGRDAPVMDTVARAVRATLGLDSLDLSGNTLFAELGGDSLSALSCSALLEDVYQIEVPVGVINNPAGNLEQLCRFIERARDTQFVRPSFASVHGKGATRVHASDLSLEKFIDADTLEAGHQAAPIREEIRTVLVTGANGFLGRFLCLDWLQRMAAVGGKVICVIRGTSDAAARERLSEVFDSGDNELKTLFSTLASQHLEVLAGDLSEAQLGLAQADWQRLTEDVDLIVHPAALVNHVLPYPQLFGPNAVGTAELIRLAISHHLKPIINVSTMAVAMQPDGSTLGEDDDIRVVSASRVIDNSRYADGYGHSKWAGEVLLREAHDRYQIPVSVFRSDMIMAHSRYAGQLNKPDMFTRWLFSIAATGIAPASFYSGNAASAHYDGLPVDFTAESVSTLGLNVRSGFETYHVLNPHDDGISMDSFVDWAIEAGYTIERVADYADWASRFETALKTMKEEKSAQSSLPLIHQLRQPMPADMNTQVSSDRFQQAVRALGVGVNGDIPHLSAPYIEKYLNDLNVVGLL